MNKAILRIALPSILTNISVPLLGLADTTIVGHLGSAAGMAAIALGSTLITVATQSFGFLRMSTSGLTAQALGRGSHDECLSVLVRSLLWALTLAVLLLLVHPLLLHVGLKLADAGDMVKTLASNYFKWVVWGIPAVLTTHSLCGWFIGMQHARPPLYVALMQNFSNIALSLFFVFVLDWGVEGVAIGTLVAQIIGSMAALSIALSIGGKKPFKLALARLKISDLLDRQFANANRDIFFRNLCLLLVTSFFTFAGARQGDIVLAANAILMQFFLLFSYFIDGFAHAGEALCGKFYGASQPLRLRAAIRLLLIWGGCLSLIFAAGYGILGHVVIGWLTNVETVKAAATDLLTYAAVIPVVSFVAFIYDGVFAGLSHTRALLIGMSSATLMFFLVYAATPTTNDSLWAAFLLYLFTRSLASILMDPKTS